MILVSKKMGITTLIFLGFIISGCSSVEYPATTYDGLLLVEDSRLDVAYLKPDADFSQYDRVMLNLAEVRFHRNWEKDIENTSISRSTRIVRIDAEDKERIVRDLSELFYSTFTEVIEENDNYELVDKASGDVLGVRVWVNDLYISAPDLNQAGRAKTYITNAGSMTLSGELYDSTSGEVLARFADSRNARTVAPMTWGTNIENRNEGRRMFRIWAGILNDGLEEIQSLD